MRVNTTLTAGEHPDTCFPGEAWVCLLLGMGLYPVTMAAGTLSATCLRNGAPGWWQARGAQPGLEGWQLQQRGQPHHSQPGMDKATGHNSECIAVAMCEQHVERHTCPSALPFVSTPLLFESTPSKLSTLLLLLMKTLACITLPVRRPLQAYPLDREGPCNHMQ